MRLLFEIALMVGLIGATVTWLIERTDRKMWNDLFLDMRRQRDTHLDELRRARRKLADVKHALNGGYDVVKKGSGYVRH